MTDTAGAAATAPFDLLTALAGDPEMARVFSEDATIESWLRTEAALARAQAQLGLIPETAAAAIAEATRTDRIDRTLLWEQSRNVGYPILPLIRQVDALLPEAERGTLHLGATTQDIMDTGLALQLAAATDHLLALGTRLCDLLQEQAAEHASTVMAGRTHAMHAVPTTWGAKLGVYLADFARHVERLREVRAQVAVVSLYGAGGTSAAYGPDAARIRELVAEDLGLAASAVPWHVSRVRLTEWGHACCTVVASTARLAHEVIDLSRTEIAELAERSGHLRGASSTMPQKANPITSEVLVGSAVIAGGFAAALTRIIEAGHDRAAGEWQAEWFLIPQVAALAATALRSSLDLVAGLHVDREAMAANLDADHGLIMSEAYMMRLASSLGREEAHDAVYAAARRARDEGISLLEALREDLPQSASTALSALDPLSYIGDAEQTVASASAAWAAVRAQGASGD